MTNIEALDAVDAWLTASGLIAGYTVALGRYSAESLVSDLPLCLVRKSGNGAVSSNIKEIDYQIRLFNTGSNIVSMINTMSAIEALATSTAYPAGVERCRVLVTSQDATEMESDVFTTMMQIRMTVEL